MLKPKPQFTTNKLSRTILHRIAALTVIVLFVGVGAIALQRGSAATNIVAVEAEAGQIAGNATVSQVPSAAGGRAVLFGGATTPPSTETPKFNAEVIVTGRNRPWDMKFLPTGDLLFTERFGKLNVFRNGTVTQVAEISDAKIAGERTEGGLLGMAIDPQFAQNRFIFTCFNSTVGDVRVVRWRLADDLSGLTDRRDIITGITSNETGRHSGCRMDFGPDGYLWVGTGDSATGGQSQQPQSLNGKILRVNRDGISAPGNLGGNFDNRIYSYGHRNTQGITFFPTAKNGVVGLSSQHGPGADDEVNLLVKGNFGWAPSGPPYNESVPMTDIGRFPDAIRAIWSSGNPTQAISGMTIINNPRWKGWNGAAAVAVQKDQHLKILRLDDQNRVTKEEEVLQSTYNRLRTVVQGPDGNLYISTDIGSNNDRIIRLTPQ